MLNVKWNFYNLHTPKHQLHHHKLKLRSHVFLNAKKSSIISEDKKSSMPMKKLRKHIDLLSITTLYMFNPPQLSAEFTDIKHINFSILILQIHYKKYTKSLIVNHEPSNVHVTSFCTRTMRRTI